MEVCGEGCFHSYSRAGGSIMNNNFSRECSYQSWEKKGWEENIYRECVYWGSIFQKLYYSILSMTALYKISMRTIITIYKG